MLRDRLPRRSRLLAPLAAAVATTTVCLNASAAVIVFDGGTAGTMTLFNTATNWNPDTVPGAGDVAQFAAAGTASNISVNAGNGGTQSVGRVEQAGTLARFLGTSGGDSTTAFTGTIQLNGVADGANNVVLRNTSTGLLTIGTFTSNTTTLSLPNASVIDVQSTGNITLSARISGAGRITKIGSGTAVLSSTASTNTGGVQIDGGTASFGSTSSFLTTAGGTFVANQIGIANGATFVYTGTVTTATIGFAVGVQLTNGGGTINVNNAATTFSQAGVVSGSGNLVKAGAGTLALLPSTNGTNTTSETFTGKLIINSGAVSSFTTTAVGNPTAFTPDQLTLNGGVFRYTDAGSTITLGTNRGVTVGAGGGGINVTSSTESLIVPAPIVSDGATAGAFTTVSAGTLRFTGANTYAGTTTVGDGTSTGFLRVNGTHTGAGSYFVQPNATLGGLGTITLAAGSSINVGGRLSPGGSISGTTAGIEFIESLDVNGSVAMFNGANVGTLLIEGDLAAVTPIDSLNVTGNLDLTGSTLQLSIANQGLLAGPLVFATYGSLTGIFSNTAALALQGVVIDYAFNGNSIALVSVPEPASLAVLAGFGGLLLRRRRVM